MTGSIDPWRTLGLTPGASIDEIRRAYRRLAKVNHPDAAGEAALPRFLAIQSAYEALAGPRRARRPGSRPGSEPRPAPQPRQEPWRADPGRARASTNTDGRRRSAPGARPSGRGADPSSGAAGDGDATSDAGRRGSRAKAGPARPAGEPGEAGSSRRAGGRRRPPNRATPGSTSYDAADEEPFEPGWSGATWYGASSGTYWTINPKEYADPRKHGPEYQRRARRSASGRWILEGEPGVEPDVEEPGAGPDGRAAEPGDPDEHTGPRPRSSADARAEDPAAPRRPTWSSAGREPGDHRPDANVPPVEESGAAALPTPPLRARMSNTGLGGPLLRLPTTPAGRLGLALLGWPPLGVAVATAIGESTGCGRFAASCAEVFSPGTWIVQVAIVLLLLALPRVAGWSAVGTLVALAAAIPAAIALSAGGGSRQPEASTGVLLAVLGLAYVAGVAWAIAGRWWPSGGSSRVPWRR
ncbi:MAG TPA: DnaJ domain-containing protein [Candidatus Limnocylindrales bacterium]|nr:DnaJ domain-containing protein [Candidatus Limnocylindrales bacterium]